MSDAAIVGNPSAPSGYEMFAASWNRVLHGVCEARRIGLYPYLYTFDGGEGPYILIGDRRLINLASNDYLGLSRHPRVVAGSVEATRRYGASVSGSPLVTGVTPLHRRLEERLAAATGQEAAALFPAGYQGNVGVISAIVGRGDTVIADRLVHSSILDGATLSGAHIRSFRHNDVEHLELRLRQTSGRRLVIVESIYSMDGDGPDLTEICRVAERHDALVMVDEAHSFGFFGDGGRGAVVAQGVADRVGIVFGTLGKALGSQGSFAAGRAPLIEYLRHTSRGFVFSTAPTPGIVGAALAALDVIASEPERIAQLWSSTRIVQDGLRGAGLDIGPTISPIIAIRPRGRSLLAALAVSRMAAAAKERGVNAQLVVPPAVGIQQARMRLQIRADLSGEQAQLAVERLVDAARATQVL